MALKTHKPSGRAAWPLVLLEGGEKLGKTHTAALLTASDKVGRSYWIEFGPEGVAEEYGAIPGVRYEIVEHDGSYAALYAAVAAVKAEARQALDDGEAPVVLVIDTMTAVWDLLKDWATNRAKGSTSNRKKLAADPHADIVVSQNYWNDANSRHKKLIALLATFPGIVVVTARGKEVSAIDDNGRPIEGKREYRVEGQKHLGYDVSCWVRLLRDEPAMVVGARSVHSGIRPGRDEPQRLPEDWTLEWLIFEALKIDPANTETRNIVAPKHELMPEQIRAEAIHGDTTFGRCLELYAEAERLGYESVTVPNERGHEELLLDLVKRLGTARMATSPATPQQHGRLKAMWMSAGDFNDLDSKLRYLAETVKRPIESVSELTATEIEEVITRLRRYVDQNTPPAAPSKQPEPAGAAP